MGVSISCVCVTMGRRSLKRTLASIAGQKWLPGDQVLVIHDGPAEPWVRTAVQCATPSEFVEILGGPCGAWGHPVLNALNGSNMEGFRLEASHVMTVDDDDWLAPGAIETIRTEVAKQPAIPHLFQLDATRVEGLNCVVWQQPWGLVDRNVSKANLVAPVGRVGHFDETVYNGDLAGIKETVAMAGGKVRWVPVVTHICGHGQVYSEPPASPPIAHTDLQRVTPCVSSSCRCSS